MHRHLTIAHAGHAGLASRSTARLPSLSSDGGHVRTISADGHPALSTCFTRFVRRPFMCSTLFMGSAPTLTGNLTLAIRVHRRKTTSALSGHTPPGRPEVLDECDELLVSGSVNGPVTATAHRAKLAYPTARGGPRMCPVWQHVTILLPLR